MSRIVKLKDITLNITDGVHGDCEPEDNSGYYFISVKDLEQYCINYDNARQITKEAFINAHKRTKLEVGDTIYANSGHTIGKSLFISENKNVSKTTFQKSVAIIKPNQDFIIPEFLYYLLKNETKGLRAAAVGSAQKNLLLDDIRNYKVELLDISEQNKILSVLKAIDKKIEINYHLNNELEKLAKTLYEYWFVQFDFPDENNRPYKSSGGKMIYNEKLKREIPINWEVKQIGSILQEQEKSSVQVNQANNTGKYPFFTSGNEILKYDEFFVDDMHCYLSTGGNACVKYYYGKASYSTDTWCISANEYTFYLHNYLVSINNQMDKLYFAGTGLKHLQKDIFKNSYIVIPPYNCIKKYNNVVSNGYKISSKKYLENQELTKLRIFLLPMLMNGQIGIIAE